MLETLIVLVVLAWLLGVLVVPVGGGLIHLLLIVAAVLVIVRLLRNGRVRPDA